MTQKLDPHDYSEFSRRVRFTVGLIPGLTTAVVHSGLVKALVPTETGFIATLPVQQVPEVVHLLAENNIAIYAVEPVD